jgi:hypothetical protein
MFVPPAPASITPTAGPEGQIPAVPAAPNTPAQGAAPAPLDPATLDGFYKAMQQSGTANAGQPPTPPAPIDLVGFANNAEALAKLASQFQFSTTLPPDVRAGIESGDVAQVFKAMDLLGQATYRQAIQHAAMLAGHGIQSHNQALPTVVGTQVQQLLQEQQLKQATPQDTHPATQYVLQALAQNLVSMGQDPKAAMAGAVQLLQGMGANVTPSVGKVGSNSANPPQQWDDWFKQLTGG